MKLQTRTVQRLPTNTLLRPRRQFVTGCKRLTEVAEFCHRKIDSGFRSDKLCIFFFHRKMLIRSCKSVLAAETECILQ